MKRNPRVCERRIDNGLKNCGTKGQSARSFQRLQTISSSISSLILLSSTSAGLLLIKRYKIKGNEMESDC